MTKTLVLATATLLALSAQADPLKAGLDAIHSQTGCYLVDYSYTETEGLKEGYQRDKRVYDVNKDKSIKEWIYADVVSPTRIRLQHILFGASLDGTLIEDSFLKHQIEDWEFDASFLYDFSKPLTWDVKALEPNLWTRRITNLDDGLRYQCAASWLEHTAYREWTCSNYAPIPGRETRDMGRKDYNTLDRTTRIVAYGKSWLERQINTKTIDQNGVRTPLARELGKTWYVRLPDEECLDAKAFAAARAPFWSVLREAWDQVLDGSKTYREKTIPGSSRYLRIMELESKAQSMDLKDPKVRAELKNQILKIIGEYEA